jgi:hypothetical protein
VWCIGETKLGGAVHAKPNQDVGRVDPEKRADLAGDLHGLIDWQSLQSLHIKFTVVEVSRGAFLSMNALPFSKRLFLHENTLAPLRAVSTVNKLSRDFANVRELTNEARDLRTAIYL